MSKLVTLVIPPFTQLNTPYPSISYLYRFITQHGFSANQRDIGIELVHRIFSKSGLTEIFNSAQNTLNSEQPEEVWRMMALRAEYIKMVDPVISFLSQKDHSCAHLLLRSLPQGPRSQYADMSKFGSLGTTDACRYLCTLFLEELTDFIRHTIDLGFEFGRYQSYLAQGSVFFDPIAQRLSQTTLIDSWLDELVQTIDTPCVGISIPFPGTLYAGLRIGKNLKKRGIKVWMGGGYVNTELRDPNDPRIWDHTDAICLDDGEIPLLELLREFTDQPHQKTRTFTSKGFYNEKPSELPFVCAPKYDGLNLSLYLQVLDSLNPAHRLWSDTRWNKITLAHGCYWKKCSFCDINLDYISRFVPAQTKRLVDQMEDIFQKTGISGFHIVDEAAPPRAMRELALELLRRDLQFSWWGNIRFESSFTPDLCRLLAASGLIMVTGGLEVAHDRLLKLMNKGVSIEQTVACTHAFQQANILVHAYLMYGFPTQTHKDTLESMEMVRQMFENQLLDSAFWHRFVLTRHSGIYANPDPFKIKIKPVDEHVFATNDMEHIEQTPVDHDLFDLPLSQALHLWMEGADIDRSIFDFFTENMPQISIKRNHIESLIPKEPPPMRANQRLIWLGGDCYETQFGLEIHSTTESFELICDEQEREWLLNLFEQCSIKEKPFSFKQASASYPKEWRHFQKRWEDLRHIGLIGI